MSQAVDLGLQFHLLLLAFNGSHPVLNSVCHCLSILTDLFSQSILLLILVLELSHDLAVNASRLVLNSFGHC